MELTNHLARVDDVRPAVLHEAWLAVVRLLGPIAPHIGEELWAALGGEGALYCASWPEVDESARVRLQVTLVVQINGKLRARLEVEPGLTEEAAMEHALGVENVQKHMGFGKVRKVIYIPDRLLNIVVG